MVEKRGLTTQKAKNHPTRGFLTQVSDIQTVLFEFDFSAYLFELSFHSFSVGLSKTFFEGVGCAVNELFSFFETKTGKFFNELNDFEFLSTCFSEYYVEAGFLLGSCTGSGGTGCNSYCSSGGFDAVFVLEDLGKFVYFLYSEVYELFSKSF